MKIWLKGYFDRNFGDDVMQLIIADNLKEHDFYVCCPQREMLNAFSECKNVHIVDSVSDIDAVVNVIGTGFIYKGKRAILEKLIIIPREKKITVKNAVVDCSIEKSDGKMSEYLIGRELNKYDYISCRDKESEDYILSRVKCPVKQHNDLVFAIPDTFIKKNTGEDCLGIIPVNRLYSSENDDYFKKLARLCDRYTEEYKKNVLIFAFDTGIENDTSAVLSIKANMKNRDMAEIILYNSNPAYIFSSLSRCGCIISSRFHGVVASLLLKVPVIGLSDTKKLDMLSERYGFSAFPKNNFNENDIYNLIKTEKPILISDDDRRDAAGHIADLKCFLQEGNETTK